MEYLHLLYVYFSLFITMEYLDPIMRSFLYFCRRWNNPKQNHLYIIALLHHNEEPKNYLGADKNKETFFGMYDC